MPKPDLKAVARSASVVDQYERQLNRVRANAQEVDSIHAAVSGVMRNLEAPEAGSLVVYGDPQSGKTEMMICLTARLLDEGHKVIVHLMNDSVDLLRQNLDRFQLAGLAPAPKTSADIIASPVSGGDSLVVFCKKNARDLEKLITALESVERVVVIDDEADYATPNAKINKNEVTRINELIGELLGASGQYIGVTATPARLNLNNTFGNRPETWVAFPSHSAYTGQDAFFSQDGSVPYRLKLLSGSGAAEDTQRALARFLVTVAHLNTEAVARGEPEENYSMLVHTSGKTADHDVDRNIIDSAMKDLIRKEGPAFDRLIEIIHEEAKELYSERDPIELLLYTAANASRSSFVLLNSKRDRATAGETPTKPTTPFTVIIGGNIVSRGVTFPNLLSMYFTRDVKTKLQQDTYIQRARMFGARGKYLEHFELTIPATLYADWHRCFVFHRLALEAVKKDNAPPVWVGDSRIAIASTSSVDRGTVDLNKGEMSFPLFEVSGVEALNDMISQDPTSISTLRRLREQIGDGLPEFLIEYLDAAQRSQPGTLAIHKAKSISGYGSSADKDNISRTKGFVGKPQLERSVFPNALHHVNIFHNDQGRARLFYKSESGVQFVQNLRGRVEIE